MDTYKATTNISGMEFHGQGYSPTKAFEKLRDSVFDNYIEPKYGTRTKFLRETNSYSIDDFLYEQGIFIQSVK